MEVDKFDDVVLAAHGTDEGPPPTLLRRFHHERARQVAPRGQADTVADGREEPVQRLERRRHAIRHRDRGAEPRGGALPERRQFRSSRCLAPVLDPFCVDHLEPAHAATLGMGPLQGRSGELTLVWSPAAFADGKRAGGDRGFQRVCDPIVRARLLEPHQSAPAEVVEIGRLDARSVHGPSAGLHAVLLRLQIRRVNVFGDRRPAQEGVAVEAEAGDTHASPSRTSFRRHASSWGGTIHLLGSSDQRNRCRRYCESSNV